MDGTSNKVSTYDTAYNESKQLDYYMNKGVTANDYAGAIKQYNGINDTSWLRSAYYASARSFLIVADRGYCSNDLANVSYGISPAFRIA